MAKKRKVIYTDKSLFTIQQMKYLKRIIGRIDFGCDIKNGRCKKKVVSTCCSACASAKGYFRPNIGYYNKRHKDMIRKLYNKDTGFLSDTGCIIPREYRSIKCTTYHCNKLPTIVMDKIDLLRAIETNAIVKYKGCIIFHINRYMSFLDKVLAIYSNIVYLNKIGRINEHVDVLLDLFYTWLAIKYRNYRDKELGFVLRTWYRAEYEKYEDREAQFIYKYLNDRFSVYKNRKDK